MQVAARAAALSLLIALFALPAFAQDKDKKDPQPAAHATAAAKAEDPGLKNDDPELKNLVFPEVKGWGLSERTIYPMEGGGYSINYDSPENGRVTVYVYNAGLLTIPNELKGAVAEQLEGSKAAIYMAVRAGVYSDLKESNTETVTLGGDKGKVKTLKANFVLSRGDVKVNSSLYVFPYRNNFIKLRITRPITIEKDLEASFAELMFAIDTIFAN